MFQLMVMLMVLFLTTLAPAATFQITPLPLPEDGASVDAHGLNELDDVVGQWFSLTTDTFHPFLLRDGIYIPIELTANPDEPANARTLPFGVNTELKIVGALLGPPTTFGFYKVGASVRLLAHPKGQHTFALGLINRGKTDTLIVGGYWSETDQTDHAWLLTRGKTWEKVEPPGSVWSRAYGVTGKLGVRVSGWFYTALSDETWVSHGFVYNRSTKKYTILDVPGACGTAGFGMNGHGHVVGRYTDCTSGLERGFYWDGQDYHLIDVDGAFATYPTDVNDAGTVVGFARIGDAEPRPSVPFLATPE